MQWREYVKKQTVGFILVLANMKTSDLLTFGPFKDKDACAQVCQAELYRQAMALQRHATATP
jgi:hypothetical protein